MKFFDKPNASDLIDGVFETFTNLREQLDEGIRLNLDQINANDVQMSELRQENLARIQENKRARSLDEKLADIVE